MGKGAQKETWSCGRARSSSEDAAGHPTAKPHVTVTPSTPGRHPLGARVPLQAPRDLTAALLTAGTTEAKHGNARQTVPAGKASPGINRMHRWPCLHGAPGPKVTTETGASRKQKPKSRIPGGTPPWD